MPTLDQLMGLTILLFLISGTAGFCWFALKGLDQFFNWTIKRELKKEIDKKWERVMRNPSQLNLHLYARACARYSDFIEYTTRNA